MTPTPEEILAHRLDALGRALSADIGPPPPALVAASRAVSQRRVDRWRFAGLSLAAGLLIAMGAVAVWASISARPGPAPAQSSAPLTAIDGPTPDGSAPPSQPPDQLATNPGPGAGTARSNAAPTMGDLRGAVSDPVAGDPRLGGSLAPNR